MNSACVILHGAQWPCISVVQERVSEVLTRDQFFEVEVIALTPSSSDEANFLH
jgi:hypothetical protein